MLYVLYGVQSIQRDPAKAPRKCDFVKKKLGVAMLLKEGELQNKLVYLGETDDILGGYTPSMKRRRPLVRRWASWKPHPLVEDEPISISLPDDILTHLDPMLNMHETVSFVLELVEEGDLEYYRSLGLGDEERSGVLQANPRTVKLTEKALAVWKSVPKRFRSHMFREEFLALPLIAFRQAGLTNPHYRRPDVQRKRRRGRAKPAS
jgi:hypothetical protein